MQKKWVIGITAMSLAAATAIGSTLAYFTMHTQQMTNTFTVAAPTGISGQLREPTWDGYNFNEINSKKADPAGDEVNSSPAAYDSPFVVSDLGFTKAATVMPGDLIPKDPTMMNTTNWDFSGATKGSWGKLAAGKQNVDVFMAMKVTYDSKKLAGTSFMYKGNNAPNQEWNKYDSVVNKDGTTSDFYIWCAGTSGVPARVSSGTPTDALFDAVKVHDGIKDPADLQDFNIVLKGAEVQAQNLDGQTAVIESQLSGELN